MFLFKKKKKGGDILKEIEKESKKKTTTNFKKGCKFLCCVPNLITMISCFLLSSLFFVAIVGFSFFLAESLNSADDQRNRDFETIVYKIQNLFTKPKIMTDTIASAIETGLLNFSTVEFNSFKDFAYLSISNSFPRFGLDQLGMGIANPPVDQYFSFSVNVNGDINYLHRYRGVDNVNQSEIYICSVFDPVTRDCRSAADESYQYWNVAGSVTTRSNFIYERTYVAPYPFYCPGTKCDLYFSYTHPVRKNGVYLGMAGSWLTSKPMRKMLEKETLLGTSFVFDVPTGYILAGSNPDTKTLQEINGKMVQIPADASRDDDIREISVYLEEKYNKDMVNEIKKNTHLTDSLGLNNIDYYRLYDQGVDLLIVRYFPQIYYYELLVTFTCLFSFALVISCCFACCCCVFIICMIDLPLRRLENKMKKVETLDFKSIKKNYSYLGEVNSLEVRFYYLVNKLEEYVAFLPQYISHQNEQKEISNMIEERSTHLSSSTAASSSRHHDEDEDTTDTQSTNTSHSSSFASKASSKFSNNSIDKVRKNRLTANVVEERYCSIVRIRWLQMEQSRSRRYFSRRFDHLFHQSFIKKHTLLTEIILKMSKFKGGTVQILDDKTFQVGFNLDRVFKNHCHFASDFSLCLVDEASKAGFDLAISIVTEKCCTAVLGSSNLKNRVIVGEILDISKQLCEEVTRISRRVDWRILTSKRVANYVNRKDFKLTPHDVMYFPQFRKENRRISTFVLEKQDELMDKEWMYQVDFRSRVDDHHKLVEIYQDLVRGKKATLDENLVKIKEMIENAPRKNLMMERFYSIMDLMVKEKMSFRELVEVCEDVKKVAFRILETGSLFSEDIIMSVIKQKNRELSRSQVLSEEGTHTDDKNNNNESAEEVIEVDPAFSVASDRDDNKKNKFKRDGTSVVVDMDAVKKRFERVAEIRGVESVKLEPEMLENSTVVDIQRTSTGLSMKARQSTPSSSSEESSSSDDSSDSGQEQQGQDNQAMALTRVESVGTIHSTVVSDMNEESQSQPKEEPEEEVRSTREKKKEEEEEDVIVINEEVTKEVVVEVEEKKEIVIKEEKEKVLESLEKELEKEKIEGVLEVVEEAKVEVVEPVEQKKKDGEDDDIEVEKKEKGGNLDSSLVSLANLPKVESVPSSGFLVDEKQVKKLDEVDFKKVNKEEEEVEFL